MLACRAYGHLLSLMFLMASSLGERAVCHWLLGTAICSVGQTVRTVDHGLGSALGHNPEQIANSVERLKSHVSTKALFCLITTISSFASFSFALAPFSTTKFFHSCALQSPFLSGDGRATLQSYTSIHRFSVLPTYTQVQKYLSFLCSLCFCLSCPISFLLSTKNRERDGGRERHAQDTGHALVLAMLLYIAFSCSAL